ncbi:MAG: glycosyltransferase family 4 protein [Ardenticatenaceae bacterium]|nr:glycosyltransferase family 4 protein [Ardenticatenaceae bacterium]MCB8946978.1 glycosyltransferase family 4 protein [Ardenticatenaceae bacterium]
MRSSQSAVGEVKMAKRDTVAKAAAGERPFRILMIAPTSFFSDYGGHIRILEEAYTLQGMGHQVAIVTYYKGSDMPDLDIRRTAPLPWRPEYEVGSSRHKIAFDVYLAWQSLVEAIRFKPDVIHGHMHEGALIGGVLSKLLRRPLVFDFQGSMTAEMTDHNFLRKDGRLYRLAFRLENFINKMPQAILTSSIKATRLLEEDFQLAKDKLIPLPDCANHRRFDPERFSPEMKQDLRQRLGLPLDRPIVAYLGLLTDYQGVPHLIEAAARLKQAGEKCHFLIMGYPNVAHYQAVARQKDVADYVTFTGKVMYQNAPAYLSLGDIAVAPKMSTSEGSGKLLNYMALGQPVVAYDSAVHREYLGDLGVYAPSGDVTAFTEAIATLLHQPEERVALGEKLRKRALQVYSWQKAGEHIVSLYKQLTK